MSSLPRLFVGSSREGKPIAEAIRQNLDSDADVILWTEAFTLGQTFSVSLMHQAEAADFAVLVMTPDDITESRGHEGPAPRDNVVFELGLFIGSLGFDRCYCLHPDTAGLKFPSDLLGITTARYRAEHAGGPVSAVGAACGEIRERLESLGPRQASPERSVVQQSLLDFCSRIAGSWWEYITPIRISALGFLTITSDDQAFGIRIVGLAHRPDGSRSADWETIGCGVSLRERKLFYSWKGRYFDRPDRLFEGFGDLQFYEANDVFVRGHGVFSEMDSTDLKSRKKTGKITRCTLEEIEIMRSGQRSRISELISKRLQQP